MKLEYHVVTDVGRIRAANEDAHLVHAEVGLFAVADGMGGHAAGEIASHLAIETIAALPDPSTVPPDELPEFLKFQVERAHDAILADTRATPEHGGMGTTLTALAFTASLTRAAYAHIGDSRLYRCRNGELEQLTRDHTWVQEQVEQGALTQDQARLHPLSSMLSRALGTGEAAVVDAGVCAVQNGDVFLICSDGLSNMVARHDIGAILCRDEEPAALAAALVDEANARGGLDNITALVIRVVSG